MEATTVGPNRTGAAFAETQVKLMLEAVLDFSPPMPINTLQMDTERQLYINEAQRIGSIPPVADSANAAMDSNRAADAPEMSLLMDKLGERLAFERTGTRLYDALITKYLALANGSAATDESGRLETLRRIRAEELSHFQMLGQCITALGGDPTAQTPCADVTAAASMGLMQVITDPRTTLAQCLNTILTAELTDNAGWELLSELASHAGQPELVTAFSQALEAESEHLTTIRGWLQSLLTTGAGSPAV